MSEVPHSQALGGVLWRRDPRCAHNAHQLHNHLTNLIELNSQTSQLTDLTAHSSQTLHLDGNTHYAAFQLLDLFDLRGSSRSAFAKRDVGPPEVLVYDRLTHDSSHTERTYRGI